MDRSNHYENAFDAYLQWHRLCYLAVDETRRTLLGPSQVKSLDFIVFGRRGRGLLVDVKGRRFPAGYPQRPRRVFECWSTEEDVDGLERWQEIFGPGYQGLLVFAYEIMTDRNLPVDEKELWSWEGRRYLYRAIAIADYRPHLRVRSPRWRTVSLSTQVYRSVAQPLAEFTKRYQPIPCECPF
jgi:hypothetical protein